MPVPFTFGTATAAIPLSQLDTNFATAITLGNTAMYLGNTTTTVGNLTLTNVTISSGTANVTANITYGTANAVVYSNASNVGVTSANLTFNGTTLTAVNNPVLSGGTANGVTYLNGSKVLTSGSALTFDGTNLALSISQDAATKATLTNSNGGTSAVARYEASNGSNTAEFGIRGTAQTTNGVLVPQVGYAYSPSAAGLALVGAAGPLLFAASGTTELMRLTSTGLGIGTSSPGAKLDVVGASSNQIRVGSAATEHYRIGRNASDGLLDFYGSQTGFQGYRFGGIDGTWATINASGNLGLGVTPSAWSSFKALQVGAGTVLYNNSNANGSFFGSNFYWNGSNNIYIGTSTATAYGQTGGQHQWFNAPSGTAGNAITFTQAMTLDASGNLGVGTTSPTTRLHVNSTGAAIATIQSTLVAGNTNVETRYISTNRSWGVGQNIIQTSSIFEIADVTANATRLAIDSSGNLGINISSPTTVVDVLGSIFTGGSSRTNGVTKTFGFRIPHISTATNPMNVIGGLSTTSVNYVYIGGSDSNIGGTAATDLFFYTAANNTTADGTLRMRIDASGIVTMSAYGAGAATFSASGVISSVSDETWKIKDGVPTNTDAMLQKLEPGYWFYNEEKAPTFGADRQLGFFAQNVHEAIGAEAAPTPEEGKPWGYYDRSVLAVTVMSLKNALNTIEELRQRIKTLENK